MNYYFTGILIILMVLLALFVKPAHARNEYLNEYGVRCGEVDFRVEQRNSRSRIIEHQILVIMMMTHKILVLHLENI